MHDITLFEMWGPIRKDFIDSHLFYVEQARKRLLSQFDNVNQEAEQAAEEWLEEAGEYFDPDMHDPGDFYEAAYDKSIEFGLLLSEMMDQTRLSVIAGMFHQWEKQLRDWLAKETKYWGGETVVSKIWSVNLGEIFTLFEGLGWNVRDEVFFAKIDTCRLVVNVYKHGKGTALKELRKKYPKYFIDSLPEMKDLLELDESFLDHTHLMVNNEDIDEFSEAIAEFWKKVPERFMNSQTIFAPKWLEDALLKDREIRNNRNK